MNCQIFSKSHRKNKTSIIVDDCKGDKLHSFQLNLERTITLPHEPNEKFTFRFNTLPSKSCSLSFDFLEHHLKSQTFDQKYEIVAEALVINLKKIEHIRLFYRKIIREYSTIYIPIQKFDLPYENCELLHICFHIGQCENIQVKTISVGNRLQEIVSETMYKTGLYSDITLVVKGKSFYVHKLILSIESQEFNTIVSKMSGRILKIDNFEPEIFEAVLYFMYTKELKDPGMSVKMIEAAYEYRIEDLKNICENFMISNLCISNVAQFLFLAKVYTFTILEEAAFAFINDKIQGMKDINKSSENVLYDKLIWENIEFILKFSSDHHLKTMKLKAFEFMRENKYTILDEKFLARFDNYGDLVSQLLDSINGEHRKYKKNAKGKKIQAFILD